MDVYDYVVLKALRVVLTQPLKRFSIVGLAGEAGVAASAAKYSLEYMHVNGLVKDEAVGRIHQYCADLDNVLARQWKILFSLEELKSAGIAEKILSAKKNVLSVILYGSVAVGRDNEGSDVDLLVIADTDSRGKKALSSLACGTVRELNISVYTPSEWRKKASVDEVFYERVVLDSISLYGPKPVVL
ncbi:nucleotidyltransferase domain-containing protein [Candidatus Micrarchaeota archaeon]|nr:nucleotidyltransferase domain-containing protein [Candidatus Micrarchaeota archaeon]